jgi:hypothetical protein
VVAQLAVAAGPGVHGRVLELDTEGKITGTVSGAAIEFKDQSGAAAGRATSGEGGYYRVDLPPGKYYYKVTAAGYKDEDHGRGIALQRSEGYAVYNFSLTKGPNDPDRKPPVIETVELGKLSGRVFEAGPEGARIGVPGATISLRRTDGNRELGRVVTGAKDPKAGREAGQYAIVLPAGSWWASVSAEGFQTLVDPQPIVIDPAKPAVRDFLLTRPTPEPGQGIKGLISIDNPELSPQAKSSVLSRVEVYISPHWKMAKPEDPAPLDARGNYSRDLAEGKYRVIAVAKGYRTAGRAPVDVFAGKYSVVNLTLVPVVEPEPTPEPTPEPEPTPMPVERLVFQGTVYEQASETAVRRPLPGASVLIRTTGQALGEAPRGTTDSQGKVKLEVAGPGQYTVLAQKTGYEPGGARVTIAPGAANSQAITLTRRSTPPKPEPVPMEEPVTVTGYVVYRDVASSTGYRGVQGAELIWTRPGSRNLPAVADRIGQFRLELPEGTYLVNVQPPAGFTGASESVAVRQGMKPKYFILQRREEIPPEPQPQPWPKPQPQQLVRVQGYVMSRSPTSTTGYAAVAGARILWAGGSGRRLPTVTSDRSGRFLVDLEAGAYDAAVQAPPGYKNTSKMVVVQQGMRPVSFVLERAGVEPGPDPQPMPDGLAMLNVRVLAAGVPLVTPPLPGAEVAILQNSRTVASGRADMTGNASFRLKPGSYEIQARFEGFGSSRQRVMLQGGVNSQTIFLKRAAGPEPEGQVAFTLRVVRIAPAIPGAPTRRSPLAGATVNVMQNRRSVLVGQTNEGGVYSGRLPPGNYQVSVTLQGFDPKQVALNLTRSPVSLEIVLNPRRESPEKRREPPDNRRDSRKKRRESPQGPTTPIIPQ